MKKILVLMVMVLSLMGCDSSKARMTKVTDTNIERYLEMKAEVENLEDELEQKDKVDLIGLRKLEKLTVEADEFFEREVLGWEEVEPDLKAWSNAVLRKGE